MHSTVVSDVRFEIMHFNRPFVFKKYKKPFKIFLKFSSLFIYQSDLSHIYHRSIKIATGLRW